jgi:hypothetical protein
MTITPNASRKTASKKTTRRIARKFTSAFTRKASRAVSRRKQMEMKAALERHSRKCIICHHPEREAIEEEFLHWRAPWKLAEDYNLADYRTIYRHARAAGILLKRRENLHSGLDAFVEAVDDVKFTGDTILRAMRAYSCIDRHGRWTEIPTQVHISTFRDPGPAPSPSSYPENDSDVIDIEPEQLDEDLEDDPEDDDPDDDPGDDDPDADDSDTEPEYSNRPSRRDATACAGLPRTSRGSPAQAPTHDAAQANQCDQTNLPQPQSAIGRRATVTDCAASSAQAMPRNAVRGHNPQSRSVSDHTARAASPAQSGAKQYSNPASRSDSTACAASPAQDFAHDAAAVDDSDEPDNDPDTELEEVEEEVLEEHATAYAASLA